MVWDLVRSVFGDVTVDEALLAGLLFGCVMLYPVAPGLAEVVARWVGGVRRGRTPEP